ncbi:MAG: UDP-glucose/GDP-mannose dehydrogenase family protein [Spirochaetes bacterium]|nr:UDP-glucose/GDP-mannose dehydrogenase family protein [Spirochaetota bacterium]
MHNIAVIGTGYVGLVTGACLSDFGLNVVCVDVDAEKIAKLQSGKVPIYEPGLEAIVERNMYYKRLTFTTKAEEAVRSSEVIFIAVGTPPAPDGSADLRYVEEAARTVARVMDGYRVIVDKSTVPIGTARKVEAWVREELSKRGVSYEFDVVSNPEFLREGSAVYDFTHPDRVVLGTQSPKALDIMKQVYRVLYLNETPFIETNWETAETIKYASNAFLAVKITFINEIANLCEAVGANVQDVARAMGKDGRIGPKFLHPGPGYGGSCFPKDTRALAETARRVQVPLRIVEATIEANEAQKHRMVEKIAMAFEGRGGLKGRTIAILGLSFKPNTDDMREAPSLTILPELARRGCAFRVYDPAAMEESKHRLADLRDRIVYCQNEYEAADGADALVILTEWNQFRNLDLGRIRSTLREGLFFDLRNIYKRHLVESVGMTYVGVGV